MFVQTLDRVIWAVPGVRMACHQCVMNQRTLYNALFELDWQGWTTSSEFLVRRGADGTKNKVYIGVKYMKIIIIGVRHDEQRDERDADPVELRSAKDALEKSIRNLIESYEISLVCEESRPGVYTIAHRLADRHNPRIRWVPMEMAPEQEQTAGIPNATERNKKRRYLDEEAMIWREQRIPEDEVRERFFVDKIRREAGNAETILVVCGCGHAEPLKEKFQKLAEQVQVV